MKKTGQKGYDQELLEWQWHQIRFRRKYKHTAAGFQNSEIEQQFIQQWKNDVKKFRESREHHILSDYQPSSEIFVGREKELLRIREALEEKAGPVVLYGIGGIGKSALARAYIKKHREEYDHVLLLSFNSNLQNIICDDYNLSISNLKYQKDQYGSRSRYFQVKCGKLAEITKKERILLVIDDLNTVYDRNMCSLFDIDCDILVTTRFYPSVWECDHVGIHVTELQSEEEWRAFVEGYRTKELMPEDEERLIKYRSKVKGHTLKMMLEVRNPENRGAADADFEHDLFSRYPLKKEECQTLTYLSIMPVQGIPESLFMTISGISQNTLERLQDYLLVQKNWNRQWQDTMISLHPIIAEAARHVYHPSPINCSRILKGMEQYLNGENAEHKNTWGRTYLENQRIEPYVFSFLHAFPQPVGWLASAFDELSTFLWIQGYFTEAEAYSLKIFASVESYYGEDHQITGEMALRTAAVYHNELKHSESTKWYLRGLDILKKCHPHNLDYWYSVGSACLKVSRLCRHEGKFDIAMKLADEALVYIKKFEEVIKDLRDDTSVFIAYCLMEKAKILFGQDKLENAENLCREALEHIRLFESKRGFDLNEFQGLLIEILVRRKKYGQAEKLARETVERAVCFRGEAYKDTLFCREMLADIYMFRGKREDAEKEYNRILIWLQREYPYKREWIARICGKIMQETKISAETDI